MRGSNKIEAGSDKLEAAGASTTALGKSPGRRMDMMLGLGSAALQRAKHPMLTGRFIPTAETAPICEVLSNELDVCVKLAANLVASRRAYRPMYRPTRERGPIRPPSFGPRMLGSGERQQSPQTFSAWELLSHPRQPGAHCGARGLVR
jgi:hypothetical protein